MEGKQFIKLVEEKKHIGLMPDWVDVRLGSISISFNLLNGSKVACIRSGLISVKYEGINHIDICTTLSKIRIYNDGVITI